MSGTSLPCFNSLISVLNYTTINDSNNMLTVGNYLHQRLDICDDVQCLRVILVIKLTLQGIEVWPLEVFGLPPR